MTIEDISNLTNSISSLSLSKEITESENIDDEPDNNKINRAFAKNYFRNHLS